jgi:hypothetical protein
MAPPGTRIIAHETSNCRRTWAPHGQYGWYIGTNLEHYRCYMVHISKTRSERVVETVGFFSTEVPLPIPSPTELATQAAKQLTHALLNPKPAGPFCQVGDEQMVALQRLTAIFEGALPARKKDTMSPLCEINDSDAPPREQIAVSPPRVVNGTTPDRAVQPTGITSTTPNSHRRLSTTPARAVTPNTPHTMIRRSIHQQNLKNNMLAETIQQANNVCSLPTGSKIRSPPQEATDTPITIMPEIANAVICPEAGKSLKNQELITMLRYKIKWMRSTANEIRRLYKTNTIRFIHKSSMPPGQKSTYGSFVVDIKEHKEERERTRLTVAGDQIEYSGDKYTRTAALTTEKSLSTVSYQQKEQDSWWWI